MNSTILEEARLWLNKEQDGLSLNRSAKFNSWIKNSFEHKKIFEEEKAFRQTFQELPKDILSELSLDNKNEMRQDEFFNKIKKVSLIAAVLCLVFLASYFTYDSYRVSFEHTYITKDEIHKKILLPDDSILALDKNSNVKVRYYKDRREIDLEKGRVLFDVASNKNRPFLIKTNDTLVEVLGTKFEVQKLEKEVIVSVVEGKVSVKYISPHNSRSRIIAILQKSDSLDVNQFGKIIQLQQVNEKMIASWEKEKLLFKQTKLKDVVKKFSQYLDYEVKIENTSIESLPISGKFSINDFENLMKSLSVIHPIHIRKVDKTFYIQKKL